MISTNPELLTFLLNSLWQAALAAVVAAGVCRLLRNGPASHRHAVWVAALVAAVMLPVLSVRRPAQSAGPQFAAPVLEPATTESQGIAPSPAAAVSQSSPVRSISLAATTASVLLGGYLLFVALRLALLAWASVRTARIRGGASAPRIPDHLERVWLRCQGAFGLRDVELLTSADVSGPVTAGNAIILPEAMLREASEDVLTTAIGHEMAHIMRRDFACNLAYEALFAPIAFHPAAWLIRREIERTREMACDELVIERLLDAGVYARSILSIAGEMMALPKPGYTLGVFDGDILEERVRRLLEKPALNLRRARLLLAGGLAALGLCAVLASGLALTARAQGAASEIMKQGTEAFNRGDMKQAAEFFDRAVNVEPSNLKAKLFLAHSLLRSSQAPSGVLDDERARARQLYLDVVKSEPGNVQAMDGIVGIAVTAKKFDEAREWTLKAVEANPKSKYGYYTLGFLDWSVTYPDYAAARSAAGMQPQDPGIIPDPALRQKLRTQHGAHLEEGFRVLQIALQIDPDYSDAMAYINLLYRIEAAITDTPEQSDAALKKADDWVQKALAAKRRQMQAPKSDAKPDADNLAQGPRMMAPPPPPPPPPPGRPRGNASEGPVEAVQAEPAPFLSAADSLTVSVYGSPDFGGRHTVRSDGMITMPFLGDILAAGLTPRELSTNIREKLRKYIVDPDVSVQVNQIHSAPFTLARQIPGEVLQKALRRQVNPVYPSSGGEGEVRLSVAISKDGRLHGVNLISAPSEDLAKAAIEAVKQWEFRPEMLSDPPADVISTVSIRFARP